MTVTVKGKVLVWKIYMVEKKLGLGLAGSGGVIGKGRLAVPVPAGV